jgi:hypothetical protein
MEASRELHAPAALSPEKESPVSIGEDDVWVQDPEWMLSLRLSVPMVGIEHPFPHIQTRNLSFHWLSYAGFHVLMMDLDVILTASSRNCKCFIFMKFLRYSFSVLPISCHIPSPTKLPTFHYFKKTKLRSECLRNKCENKRQKAQWVRSVVHHSARSAVPWLLIVGMNRDIVCVPVKYIRMECLHTFRRRSE